MRPRAPVERPLARAVAEEHRQRLAPLDRRRELLRGRRAPVRVAAAAAAAAAAARNHARAELRRA